MSEFNIDDYEKERHPNGCGDCAAFIGGLCEAPFHHRKVCFQAIAKVRLKLKDKSNGESDD